MLLLLTGCSTRMAKVPSIGPFILTYNKVPFTRDLNDTPVSDSSGKGMVIRVREPFSGYGINAEFSSNALGDIARRQGLKRIYFADMEELNVLGMYREYCLHVYGE